MNLTNYIPQRWFRFFALTTLALSLAGCFWPEEDVEPLSFTLPANFSNVPLAVGSQTYTVVQGEVVQTLVFEGVVQAGTQRELYFEVNGPLTAVLVANGDPVQPGDDLMTLDAEEAELALAEALLRQQMAQLRLDEVQTGNDFALALAELELEIAELRLEKMQWAPDTPREDIEVAQRQVQMAQAKVTQAQNGNGVTSTSNATMAQLELDLATLALQRAQRNLGQLQLRAPISGTIRMGPDLRPGFPVEAFAPVARIVDPGSLVIESNLAAVDQAFLFEGMPVSIEMNLLPGVELAGEIRVLPQPYGTGNSPITQILPEAGDSNVRLREGAAVQIRAEVGRRENVLWLPNQVVQTVAGQAYVVVREGDQLRDQAIEVGLVGDERTEIVAGLSAGMQVMGP